MPVKQIAGQPTLQPKRRAQADLFGVGNVVHGASPSTLLELLDPEIKATIQRLTKKSFTQTQLWDQSFRASSV